MNAEWPDVCVTVAIPVYNAEKHLKACLDSVLAQSLREIEVICVDDGSTDGSAEILAGYAAADSRLRVLRQENSGQGAARNRAIGEARGKYVYFADADDELASPGMLEKLCREASRLDLDALFFDAETKVDEGLSVPTSVVNANDYIRKRDYSAVVSGRELFAKFLENREYTVSPCLVFLRRGFIAENAIAFPGDRIFYEDNIFMTRVMLSAKRASHRPWRLYLRKVHEGSTVTSRATMRHLRGYLACYIDCLRVIEEGGFDRRVRSALNDRRVIYKLNVRRIVDANPGLAKDAEREMPPAEYAVLRDVMVYPFAEKALNAFRCLRDRGLFYTIRRIFFGREKQP